MIEYSPNAKVVKAKFFEYRNDIDIYTEDNETDREFYVVLFRRLIENKIKINDVYPLGGKHEVIRAFEEYKPKSTHRRKIFIVDGDLDLIIEKNRPNEKDFYVLDAYCVENFLVDYKASVKLTYYNHGVKSLEDCGKMIDFDNWVKSNSTSLINLFIHLAFLKEVGGSPLIKHVTQFIKRRGNETLLDTVKVDDYALEIKNSILNIISQANTEPTAFYHNRISELENKWVNNQYSFFTIVSGKDYLLPLLQFRINNIVKKLSLIPKRNIKLFLADNCDLTRLEELKTLILN